MWPSYLPIIKEPRACSGKTLYLMKGSIQKVIKKNQLFMTNYVYYAVHCVDSKGVFPVISNPFSTAGLPVSDHR